MKDAICAKSELTFKNVHLTLPAPFTIVKPTSFYFSHIARRRSRASINAPHIKSLSEFTHISLKPEDFGQPWVRVHDGFVAFDSHSKTTDILAIKKAQSCLKIKSLSLTATFTYSDHKNYEFSLTDAKGMVLVTRSKKAMDSSLAKSEPIALYTLGGEKPYGWAIISHSHITTFIPYIGIDSKLRVYVYQIKCQTIGGFCASEHKWSPSPITQMPMMHTNDDREICFWGNETMSSENNDQVFSIPTLWRITPGSQTSPPSMEKITLPDDINLWPLNATQTWPPTRLLLAAIVNNLNTLQTQALQMLPEGFWDNYTNEQWLTALIPNTALRTTVMDDLRILSSYFQNQHLCEATIVQMKKNSTFSSQSSTSSRMMVLLDS